MAVVLESNTQTEAELTEALEAAGYTAETQGKPKEEEAKPEVAEEKPSESPEKPKVEKTEAEGDKSADDQESPEKDTSQEKPQEDKDKGEDKEAKGDGEKSKSRGGWQKRLADLTRQRETIEDQLEIERGSKVALQRQLDEVKSKLDGLQPKESDKPAELVKPKRPKLKDFDFDPDQLDAAEEKYDSDLDAYYKAVRDKELKEALDAEKADREKQDRERAIATAEQAFKDRREKGKAYFPDYDDLYDALPEDAINLTGVVGNYITSEAENPAILLHFLMKDILENDGKETDRIMKLNDYQKLRAIGRIEDRLIAELGEKPKVTKKETKEEEPVSAKEAAEEKPPAKEVKPRRETPEAPIKPVGGSAATGKGKDYHAQLQAAADLGDNKEYRRIRALMQQESQPARV